MPHTIQSTFFEPFIHGLDVMLAKAERAMTRHQAVPDSEPFTVRPHRDLVNLPGVAEQVAAQHETAADARLIHLFVDVAPDALVVGDSHELHRVIEQLVASALENTMNGGCVTISGAVSHGVVTLTFTSYRASTPSESRSRFENGAGTARSSLPSPALTFFASDVGQILRAHGGRMEVSSLPDLGPRFTIRLPVG